MSFYNGTGGHTLVIAEAGNVGIGTTSPSQKLTIAGNISASNQSSDMNMDLNVGSTDTNHDTRLRFLVSGSVKGMVGFDRGNDTINLTYGGKDVYHLNIDKSGNVGFGTANTSFTAGTNSSGIEIQKTGSTVLRLDNSADNTTTGATTIRENLSPATPPFSATGFRVCILILAKNFRTMSKTRNGTSCYLTSAFFRNP